MTSVRNDPQKPSLWGEHETWRLQTAHRTLREAIRRSHELCATIAYERIDRELQRLETEQQGLLAAVLDCVEAIVPNPRVSQALAVRIANYYRQLGEAERAVEDALAHAL